jgi:uncharacterized protein YndB with AHSA1/START domain
METSSKKLIVVSNTVRVPVEKAWKLWTETEHITKWNFASEDWHSPSAQNDLRVAGKFLSRMEAKEGSVGFDFGGVYSEVKTHETIAYTLGDGRKVSISFGSIGNETRIVEIFEAEDLHSVNMQRTGWQSILDNFKKYAEAH